MRFSVSSILNFSIIRQINSFLLLAMEMVEAKRLKRSPIHDTLPTEIFVKILKMLGFKSIKIALATCKRWKQSINDFKIVEAVYCMLIFK